MSMSQSLPRRAAWLARFLPPTPVRSAGWSILKFLYRGSFWLALWFVVALLCAAVLDDPELMGYVVPVFRVANSVIGLALIDLDRVVAGVCRAVGTLPDVFRIPAGLLVVSFLPYGAWRLLRAVDR